MPVNPHRGEVKIELDGQTLLMRPTFECLVQIEEGTGRPIMELVRRFIERSYGFSDVTAVIAAGLKGAGAPVTDERVAEMVFDSGLLNAVVPASRLLFAVIGAEVGEDDVAGLDEDAENADGSEPGDAPGEAQAAEG